MTIEIADRLVKLRKKYGYSQEELADKLGLSRQAVSKWERAEASPDTDNLICLAKLYGVSLDELLATDEDLDTIVEEQVKEGAEEAKEEKTTTKGKEEGVIIGKEGIFIKDKDGSSVTINHHGITCCDKDGNITKKHEPLDPVIKIINGVEAVLGILAVVAFILLGTLLDAWACAWVVFFIPEIICSIARCIRKKNANHFNMPFTACFAFFLVCMVIPFFNPSFPALWHPMWVVYLSIPLYYTTVGLINKALGKDDEDDDEDDDDEDDDEKEIHNVSVNINAKID